jgi:DNA polymerase-3 subunit delta'
VVDSEGRLALPWLRDALRATLHQHRGHALLVHGAPGDGAWDFGLALAQGWLCEGDDARRPCGHCAACNLVRSWTHPDFGWLVPQDVALAREMPVQVDERRKPSRQIRVDEVREALDALTSTSGRGRGRALVLFPGEALNAVAASALLKSLEEPPQGTRIVICAAEPARLLPTIRSRCQRLSLPRPTADEAVRWLQAGGVESPETLLAAVSGRPLDAARLAASGMTADAWNALPRRLAEGDAAALAGLGVPAALDTLAKLCHDAMAAAVGSPGRFFSRESFVSGLQLERLAQWHRSLQRHQRHADHPWNEPLLLDALVSEGRDALRPRTLREQRA